MVFEEQHAMAPINYALLFHVVNELQYQKLNFLRHKYL